MRARQRGDALTRQRVMDQSNAAGMIQGIAAVHSISTLALGTASAATTTSIHNDEAAHVKDDDAQ
jgi:hypothetical protein